MPENGPSHFWTSPTDIIKIVQHPEKIYTQAALRMHNISFGYEYLLPSLHCCIVYTIELSPERSIRKTIAISSVTVLDFVAIHI